MKNKDNYTGADLVVDTLIKQDVEYIFGIPGAKIDQVFDVLNDRGPQLIVSRHEQNAAFMAAGYGRIKGEPGVVLVTSGPGASNLATGLVTANAEGDAIVAIAGNVSREDRLKRTHQSMENATLFAPICKYSKEVLHQNGISEALTNAFRAANSSRKGAAFVSLPSDILNEVVTVPAIKKPSDIIPGPTSRAKIAMLIEAVNKAKLPVILLGMRSSEPYVTTVIRRLLAKFNFPVVETFQASGVISRELEPQCFYGRVGLFKNQPGDKLLAKADLVITIGYDPIEYDPKIWNKNQTAKIIHIDDVCAEIDNFYQPDLEMIGDITLTLIRVIENLEQLIFAQLEANFLSALKAELNAQNLLDTNKHVARDRVHPITLVNTLREILDDDTIVCCDVGSHYIWMARNFRSYQPHTLLFSNGMQTLGVAMPWAIGAQLAKPQRKIISMSGDGGFLFSAMELETAVRLNTPLVHIIWNDGQYNMVAFQQEMKYNRTSGIDFGPVDFVKYAESFGAIGMRVNRPEELKTVLEQAMQATKPVIIDVPVDYADNIKLGAIMHDNQLV